MTIEAISQDDLLPPAAAMSGYDAVTVSPGVAAAVGHGKVLPPDTLGVDLAGKIDFQNVGTMGHARGGEGVRAAYEQYRDAGSARPTEPPSERP